MLDVSRGVNLLADPRQISDGESVSTVNLFPVKPGILSTRGALGFVALHSPSGVNPTYPVSFAVPPFDSIIGFVSVAFTPAVGGAPVGMFIALADLQGNLLTVMSIGVGTRPHITVLDRRMYVFPGYPSTTPGYVIRNRPGEADSVTPTEIIQNGVSIAWFTWDGTGNSFSPRVAAPYRFRMVYANLGPGYESHVVFSDRYLPATIGNDVLLANGRSFQVGNRDGDVIVAGVEILMTAVGSPAQSAFLILKQFSAHVITGEPNESTDVTDPFGTLEVGKVSFDCGCASAETVVSTPYGTVWAGPDDVWIFEAGQVPRRIGSKIRPALKLTPASLRYRWTGAYYDGIYRLAIFGDGQDAGNNVPCKDQWWLDLRNGPPATATEAMWWGPQQFNQVVSRNTTPITGTYCMAIDTRAEHESILYGLERGDYGGSDPNGLVIVDYDNAQNRDITWQSTNAYMAPALVSGTEITIDLRTKEFGISEDPMVDKLYEGIEMNLWPSETGKMRVDVIMDAGEATDSSGVIVNQTGFVTNVDPLDGSQTMSHKTQAVVAFPADPSSRYRGKTFQVRLYTTAEIVVSDDNDAFLFDIHGVSRDIIATLTHGTYTDLTAFLLHLTTQMGAASGVTFAAINNPVDITVTGSTWWFPVFQGGVDPINERKTRKIGSILGFNTSVLPAVNATQTAAEEVYIKNTPTWEIAGINLRGSKLPRRP